MSLPKIQHQLFDITIPSSGKKTKFRPFLTREEKILLTAEESNDAEEMINALAQVITNCAADNKLDPYNMPIFDLEYIFLKLRARSVSNISEISIKDADDEQVYKFPINLDMIDITKDPNHTPKIPLDEKIGIIMKYPTINLTREVVKKTTENKEMSNEDLDFFITKNCVAQIWDEVKVYNHGDFTDQELEDFLLDLNKDQGTKIKQFFETIPKLRHEISYKNKLGGDKKLVFEGINDFFQ